MKIQTKRNLLRAATATAVVCAAAVVFLPAVASAASFTASSTVRVHRGPSLSSPVVDSLHAGETVDVGGCRQGWCYITHSGPDGFVSSSYLRNGGRTVEPNFNLNFNFPQGSFSIGTGGISIGVGQPPDDHHDDHGDHDHDHGNDHDHDHGNFPGGNHDRDRACFYSSSNARGSSFCLDKGEQVRFLGNGWNDNISSISNRAGLEVTVCADVNYRNCRTYTTSASSLRGFDNKISSIRVR